MIYLGDVTEIQLSERGEVLFSVEDSAGTLYYPCTLLTPMSGYHGTFTLPGLRVGSKVLICANPTDKGRSYYLLGGLLHKLDAESISVDGIASVLTSERAEGRRTANPDVADARAAYEVNEDYTGAHLEDVHIEAEDSWVNLSQPYGLTLNGSPRVSVQIPEGEDAIFRVSAGGVASNRILNADPFTERLFSYLDTIVNKVNALERAVNAIAPGVSAAYEAAAVAADATAPGTGTPIRQQSLDMQQALVEASALGVITPAAQVKDETINQDVNPYVNIP
jgi:outer membrane murein-binding lipoprotein Lpp